MLTPVVGTTDSVGAGVNTGADTGVDTLGFAIVNIVVVVSGWEVDCIKVVLVCPIVV